MPYDISYAKKEDTTKLWLIWFFYLIQAGMAPIKRLAIPAFLFMRQEEKKLHEKKTNSSDITEKTQQIRVETSFGTLIASAAQNSDYPGIYICIELPDGNGGMYEQDIVLVEDTPDNPGQGSRALRVAIWEDVNSESDTQTITLLENRKDDLDE
jgi:hypothetical protein